MEKKYLSWLALWVGLIVGFLFYGPLNFNNYITGESSVLLGWITAILGGIITGGVVGIIDRKNAIIAGLSVGFLIFMFQFISSVVQFNMQGLNTPADWLRLSYLYYVGWIVGGLVGGMIISIIPKKK